VAAQAERAEQAQDAAPAEALVAGVGVVVPDRPQATGRWPRPDDGPIPGTAGETWQAVESALHSGLRGIKGGSSLDALLKQFRPIPGCRSKLTTATRRRGSRGSRNCG
jgi:hypothetical protein